MIYKNRVQTKDGDSDFQISYHASPTPEDVVDTYEDWEEFMIRFPIEKISRIKISHEIKEDVPNDVMSRINLLKQLEGMEDHAKGVLECKIRTILQENSYPEEVLNALPEYIISAKFNSEEFTYTYVSGIMEISQTITDSIMQWYREPDEGTLVANREKFGNWNTIEAP